MKKIVRKAIGLALSATMLAGIMTGCGSGKDAQTTSETVTDSGTQTGAQAAEGETKQGDTSPITIKLVNKDMSADDEVAVKYIEAVSKGVSEQIGREVTIEIVPISEGTYSENMGLLLQSGEIPDLMYFQGGDYQFAITQQILEDLNPYIEKSTYVKAMMQPFNTERMANYPYLLWLAPDRIKVPVVRKDWFEATQSGKTLLENPTPENYKAFFKELKEKNNLKAAYTVPGDLSEMDTVFNLAFGVDKTWVQQDGAYVYSKVSNAMKEKLAYYADLYKEGLLDKEYLSMKWDTKEAAFYDGSVGVVAGTQGAVVNIYNNKMITQNGESAELMVLPPAKGTAQGYTPSDVSKESRGWAISSYSENKEVAFAILEYLASPEGQILDKLGYEEEHHNIVDGKYELTDKISEWFARFHESIYQFDVEFADNTPYYCKTAYDALDMVNQYSSFDNTFVLPDEYTTNWDATEALYAEYAADVISGKKSIDTFDAYVEEWYSLGGKEVTEYANQTIK